MKQKVLLILRENRVYALGDREGRKLPFFGGGGVASKSQAVHRMLNGHICVVKKTGNNALHLTENL